MNNELNGNRFCLLTKREKEFTREKDVSAFDGICTSFLNYMNNPTPLDRSEINTGIER